MNFTSDMVKPLREKMDLTQEEMARKINVGVRTIARWEHPEKTNRIHRAVRDVLAKLYSKHMEA